VVDPRTRDRDAGAAGAIARKYLSNRLSVRIYGYLSQIGALTLEAVDPAFA